jgi:TRAP-type mannitol/chloroaromatic compound transport system permease small subunit
MVIPVGAFLLLLQGIAKFIRDVQKAKGREASQ